MYLSHGGGEFFGIGFVLVAEPGISIVTIRVILPVLFMKQFECDDLGSQILMYFTPVGYRILRWFGLQVEKL